MYRLFVSIIFFLGWMGMGPVLLGEGVALEELAKKCQGKVFYEKEGTVGQVQGNQLQLQCRRNSACFFLNGVAVYGQYPVSGEYNRLKIHSYDWNRVLVPLLTPAEGGKISRICIDAGHGGNDSGAHSNGLVEKDLALDIALKLKNLLEKRGLEVVLTRGDDRFVPIDQRPRVATAQGCDLFLSIHLNAASSQEAEGIETYILPPAGMAATSRLGKVSAKDGEFSPNQRCNEQNLHLGYCLQRRLVALESIQDRGIRRGRFKVLRDNCCPAALVECGFITNPSEAKRLERPSHRDAIARALYEGICDYGNLAP
jgi:N-acetylmuramoyl-L-alanine amidase